MSLFSSATESFEKFAAGPTEPISCHIHVKAIGNVDIEQVFSGMAFPSYLLAERQKIKSATILGLICGIRHHVERTGIPVEAAISAILDGASPAANIIVATTRTPDFAEATYRNGRNGFRRVGFLIDASVDPFTMIPAPEFNGAVDVPATIGTGSGASEYFEVWSPMDVSPKSHFIIIFVVDNTAPSPIIHAPEPPELPPFFHGLFLAPSSGFELESALSLPSSSSASPSRSSGRRSRSASPSPYRVPAVQDKSEQINILKICSTEVPNFEILQPRAQFVKGKRGTPLVSLVRSYYAMEKIIFALGLDPTNLQSSRSFTIDHGQTEFTVLAIITAFKWEDKTFTTKRGLYNLAKSVAHRHWKGSETDTDPAVAKLEHIYQGIRFIWAENGPLARPEDTSLPASHAQGDERCAADLRQTDLEKSTKVIFDKYTDELPPFLNYSHHITIPVSLFRLP
ncbi:hypothetical protein C8R45DRAFT_1110074 [Mycena sanguinolenta]|nr:hypothetical protein C8R45DRAFT_1110074 [Mycena sanguinolenta]